MVDLDAIRERWRSLYEELSASVDDHDCPYRDVLVLLVEDLAALIREIEELRSMCKHQHLIQVFDSVGGPTDAYTCVNCHQTFSKERPLQTHEDFSY